MMPDLPRITGEVFTRAAFHIESGIFRRIDVRYHKKMAELLATLQLADEIPPQSKEE